MLERGGRNVVNAHWSYDPTLALCGERIGHIKSTCIFYIASFSVQSRDLREL